MNLIANRFWFTLLMLTIALIDGCSIGRQSNSDHEFDELNAVLSRHGLGPSVSSFYGDGRYTFYIAHIYSGGKFTDTVAEELKNLPSVYWLDASESRITDTVLPKLDSC